MNRMEHFAQLAARARQESVPPLDIAPRVLATLEQAEPLAASTPMIAFAGLSLLAASVLVTWAVNALLSLSDPLGSLFYPLAVVLR